MKKLVLLLVGVVLFASCSNILSEKYNLKTYGADIAKIEKEVSKEDKELLDDYIKSKALGIELNGLTYQQILDKAKEEQEKKKQAIEQFYNTKFTNGNKFISDIEEMMNKKYLKFQVSEIRKFGFFTSYKTKEGTIENYTYKQIIDEAPEFYEKHK